MFLKDALLRCSRLEDEVASVYADLAVLGATTPELAAEWTQSSRKERQRSRLLRALAEISTALGDEGPFLVQVPVQMADLTRALENVRRRLDSAVDSATGRRCVEALESVRRAELYAALLEIAEPELRRAQKLVDSEIRGSRRATGRTRSRTASMTKEPCAPALP